VVAKDEEALERIANIIRAIVPKLIGLPLVPSICFWKSFDTVRVKPLLCRLSIPS
jgi:hypothetical protein